MSLQSTNVNDNIVIPIGHYIPSRSSDFYPRLRVGGHQVTLLPFSFSSYMDAAWGSKTYEEYLDKIETLDADVAARIEEHKLMEFISLNNDAQNIREILGQYRINILHGYQVVDKKTTIETLPAVTLIKPYDNEKITILQYTHELVTNTYTDKPLSINFITAERLIPLDDYLYFQTQVSFDAVMRQVVLDLQKLIQGKLIYLSK